MSRGAQTKQQTARKFAGRVSLVIAIFALTAISLLARAVHLDDPLHELLVNVRALLQRSGQTDTSELPT